jgi:hypothetical protein
MALEGNLREFGPAEALGLVARQEKTGCLQIDAPPRRFTLHFNRGKLIQARAPVPDPDDSFLALLRDLQVLNADQWKALRDWQEIHADRDLVEGILSLGFGEAEPLREWLLLHLQGQLDVVLSLTDGRFRFEPALSPASFCIPLSEPTEFLLMETGRRADEAREVLTSELRRDSVPRYCPGERPLADDPLRRMVLRLIDGKRTVGEMIRTTSVPSYEILMLLRELIQEKCCTVLAPGRTSTARTRNGPRPTAARRNAVFVLLAGIVVISLVVGIRFWLQLLTGGGTAP